MRGWRSLYTLVATHMKDPKLRIAFSLQSLLIGGNPFNVTSIYSLITCAGAALRRALGDGRHRRAGAGPGRACCRRAACRCAATPRSSASSSTSGRATGVELADGERLGADIVVSNADTAWTYRHLIEPQHRPHWTDKRIDRKKYSMSLFVWYFGTKRQYPDVPHHTMVLGPRYEGLLKDIFQRHHLGDDFSLYLHRPTATDPAHGAARPRRLLRAVAGAAPGQRHRLAGGGRALPPAHRAAPARDTCCRVWARTSSPRA